MKKPSRVYLVQKIINAAKLPEGKKTLGYFTKEQLIELLVYLEKMKESINDKEEV